MKLSRILYARSYEKDYRWIYRPALFEGQDNDLLIKLSKSANVDPKSSSNSAQETLPTILLLPLSSSYALVKIGSSNQCDCYGRRIQYLEGWAFKRDESGNPAIFVSGTLRKNLNFAATIDQEDIRDLDRISNEVNEVEFDYSAFDIGVDDVDSNDIDSENAAISIPHELEFSWKGYTELCALLESSRHKLYSFAFGMTPRMIDAVEMPLDIIALTKRSSKTDNYLAYCRKANIKVRQTCEIGLYVYHDRSLFSRRDRFQLIAKYRMSNEDDDAPWQRASGLFDTPVELDSRLKLLVSQLTGQGWVLSDRRGQHVWSYLFERFV